MSMTEKTRTLSRRSSFFHTLAVMDKEGKLGPSDSEAYSACLLEIKARPFTFAEYCQGSLAICMWAANSLCRRRLGFQKRGTRAVISKEGRSKVQAKWVETE